MTSPGNGWSCPTCGAPLTREGESCSLCVTLPAAQPEPDEASFLLPGFRTERILGAGGMGVVVVARDESLGRRVAIKTIHSSRELTKAWIERFDREARLMATVEDPNVVRIYSSLKSEGRRFLVMEYVEGETLADRLGREKGLHLEHAMRVALQVAYGLQAAASRGVIHRDVKPANILIDLRENARVTDFGLSRSIHVESSARLTQEGRFVGTPAYVAPEQAEGLEVGIGTDIYSLGIVMYEMIAGEVPFKGSTPLAIVAKHLSEPLPRLRKVRRDVPSALEKLVEKMTAKKPEGRPQSWDEVIDEIQKIMRTWAAPMNVEQYSSTSMTLGFVVMNVMTGTLVGLAAIMTVFLMSVLVNLGVVTAFGDEGQRWMQENSTLWIPTSLLAGAVAAAAVLGFTVWIIRRVASLGR